MQKQYSSMKLYSWLLHKAGDSFAHCSSELSSDKTLNILWSHKPGTHKTYFVHLKSRKLHCCQANWLELDCAAGVFSWSSPVVMSLACCQRSGTRLELFMRVPSFKVSLEKLLFSDTERFVSVDQMEFVLCLDFKEVVNCIIFNPVNPDIWNKSIFFFPPMEQFIKLLDKIYLKVCRCVLHWL